MSNEKHSPSPWTYAKWNIWDAAGQNFAMIASSSRFDPERVEANGNLIAAAPELLAALEALFSNPHIYPGDLVYQVRDREGLGWDGPAVTQWSDAVTAAKAAIAKAKGEQS